MGKLDLEQQTPAFWRDRWQAQVQRAVAAEQRVRTLEADQSRLMQELAERDMLIDVLKLQLRELQQREES